MLDEVRTLDQLYKVMNTGGKFRCSLCNSVSNDKIATEIGDYKENMSFTHDPKNGQHFICIDCAEVIEDQRQWYEFQDQIDDMIDTLDSEELSLEAFLERYKDK